MSKKKWKLLDPIQINGLSMKNRMIMSPMLTCMAASDNTITEQMLHYYSARARGGIGTIITEYTYIDTKTSKARNHQLGNYGEHCLPGLNKLANTIQSGGARAFLQICHAGRQSSKRYMGLQPVAPSAVPNLGEMPRELKVEEIQDIEMAFAEAAERAQRAGFSGVEIHGANGYLLSQFLSPYTNRRNDTYGGELVNRARFALETLKRIRNRVRGQFVVGYRMNGADYLPNGISLEDAGSFARMLEEAGADYIHVSAGMQESWQYVVQPMYIEDACLVHLAERVKRSVEIPVISVGAHTVGTAEKALQQGQADLVAFGRSLIADPELPQKIFSGKIEDIRPCIRGNEGCVSNTRIDHPIRCEINPAAGREAEFVIQSASKRKSVLIIGGGIAGLEAARLAALTGHEVTVLEKTQELGGHLIEACVPKFKDTVKRLLRWIIHQIQKDGINLVLETEATPELVRERKPDALIVALGSDFIIPKIEGVYRPFVVLPDEAFLSKKDIGQRVVIIGGGTVGCELALYLTEEKNRKVVIIEKEQELIPGATFINRIAIMEQLQRLKVEQYCNCSLTEIIDGGVLCRDQSGEEIRLAADTVVLSIGVRAKTKLVEQFQGLAPEVKVIGDCLEARDIYHAFEDAWQAVLDL